MTSRLIVLEPDWSQIPQDRSVRDQLDLSRLGHGADYSGGPLLQIGDRPVNDHCQIPEAIDPRFPNSPTHHRAAPWVITTEGQCYPADIPGMQEYDEIWVFKCGWSPLPDEENPWREIKRGDTLGYPDDVLEMMGLTRGQIESEFGAAIAV